MCDSFNIPLLRIIDTPGFVVGLDAERRGAPGHIMNFMNATCLTTVPQITVICRKAYGRAYVAMGGGAHNDAMLAWPGAEVSFMDPVFATSIVNNHSGRRRIRGCAGRDPEESRDLGHGAHLLRAGRCQAAGNPRLPDPPVRHPSATTIRRRRRASDADLADELLTRRCPTLLPAPAAAGRTRSTTRRQGAAEHFGIRLPTSHAAQRRPSRSATPLPDLHPPFAVKVVSRDILHKSDAGGVTLNRQRRRGARRGRGDGDQARHRRSACRDGWSRR